ncbi:MAG: hypothetical protein M1839_004636, partial [Geoglossum umbratile]
FLLRTQLTVELPLDQNVQLKIRDGSGRTTLSYSAGSGRVKAAKSLLDKGAELEATDKVGRTALSIAAGNGKVDTVETLPDKGAKVETMNRHGHRCCRMP